MKNKKTVLIIEDQQVHQHILKNILIKLKFNVLIADNGLTGIEVIENFEHKIDYIILDLLMERSDGIDFLCKYKAANNIHTDTEIVLYSSSNFEDQKSVINFANSIDLKILTILPKPAKPSDISKLLILDKIKTFQQSPKKDSSPHIFLNRHDITSALVENDFIPYYQPIFDAQSKKIVALEVLARLPHSLYGVLSPISFLDLIKQMARTNELDWKIIQQCLEHFHTLHLEKHDIKLAINISTETLEETDFDIAFLAALDLFRVPPKFITLEITENSPIDSSTDVLAKLSRLRVHGVCISLNNFGRGYSSLSLLENTLANQIKIDRSYIKDISENQQHATILRSITQIANKLNLEIVVEGVENQLIEEKLSAYKVNYYQGFKYSKPLDLDSIEIFLKNNARLFLENDLMRKI
ncbi:EAL domain-containing response regulator [Thalassotalea psychrophila]|uniref:EAL domain-containing response regulator n=1 Tax=Thalassotalea psychrophila TaxID=3065647 RepID=A0ABY9TRB3_9GAMM|nr:EAL domain-containing response regulator [Colwelliaceae bacterium SQ149]